MHSEVFVAPWRKGRPVEEAEWITIVEGPDGSDKPCWSADGNALYFTSDRDGSRCIWLQRLDPTTKRPTGPPEAFCHFHSARRSPMNVPLELLEMSVARDQVIINLGEETGNLWLAELQERR